MPPIDSIDSTHSCAVVDQMRQALNNVTSLRINSVRRRAAESESSMSDADDSDSSSMHVTHL